MFDKIRYRLVFNRRHQLNRDGRGLVQMECLLNGQRVYFSTKVYLRPEEWDGHYVTNHPLAAEMNQYLFDEQIKLQRIEFSFVQRGRQPTLAIMKNAVRNDIAVTATFAQFVKSVVQHSASRGKHTRDSYMTLVKIVEAFRKNVTLGDIDLDFLNRFVSWQQDQGMSQSTISGRLKSIRAIVNEAIARKLISVDDDPFLHFRIPKIKNREESLTFDEVRKLERLKLKKREARIRDCALMAIYTGLRYHDLTTLTSDMLLKEHGKTWLIIEPRKTSKSSGMVVRLPLYSLFGGKALALIEKRGSVERLTHIGNNASANRTLKELVKRIGVADSRHITFHTLRHTFCTLLIAKGVPITTVSKLAGHTKIEQTQRYAHIAKTMIANDVKKAFKVASCDTGEEISDIISP